MTDATSYWGVHWGNAGDNYTTSCYGSFGIARPATCNGNGDGVIAKPLGSGFWQQILYPEAVLVWQHLANAGMIQGSFAGYFPSSGVGPYETVGLNIPPSRMSTSAGFSLGWLCATDTIFQPGPCGHTIFYGAQSPTAVGNITDLAMYPTLTNLDAQRIDQKIDDGLPATGSVTALPTGATWFPTNCTTTAVASTALYAVSVSGPQCSLMFNGGF